MKKLITLALLLSSVFALNGYKHLSTLNPINPPSVMAATLLPMCDTNGACNYQYNYTWGYCQWQSYQTAKTFTVAVEIGINSGNVSDVCYVPLAFGGNVVNAQGVTNYTPWTANLSSMFLNVRACTGAAFGCAYPSQQEHVFAHKYTVKGTPQSVPFSSAFITPLTTNGFMVVFNDDLIAAKPTTINLSFSGNLQ